MAHEYVASSIPVDIVALVFTVALAIVAGYVAVGVALLPVWAAGAAFRVDGMRRAGGGWWTLPRVVAEALDGRVRRLTEPQDGSPWKRPDPAPPADEPAAQSDWARGLGELLLWTFAVVGAFVALMYGHDAVIEPLAGGVAGEAALIGLVLATAAAAAAAWVFSQRYRHGNRPPVFRFSLAVAVVCGALSYLTLVELDVSRDLVSDYCSFGAVSQRQLDTCQAHVTANRVRSLDTPASLFAVDASSDAQCGARSGPFCADVLNRRYLQEQQPPPGQ